LHSTAGGILIGKANVSVMLHDVQSNNPIFGRTNDPGIGTMGTAREALPEPPAMERALRVPLPDRVDTARSQ